MSLTQTLQVNLALSSELLEAIPEAALADRYDRRTRAVASQFAHIHYVRVRNVHERGKDLGLNLETFERGAEPSKKQLRAALKASAAGMVKLMEKVEASGRVPSWSGSSPESFLAYHVSHESHHRGLILVSLRLGGHKLSAEITNDLWYRWRKGP